MCITTCIKTVSTVHLSYFFRMTHVFCLDVFFAYKYIFSLLGTGEEVRYMCLIKFHLLYNYCISDLKFPLYFLLETVKSLSVYRKSVLCFP